VRGEQQVRTVGELRRGGQRLDPETNKPCPWSDRFRDALTPMLAGQA
jgi:hypothetical protein